MSYYSFEKGKYGGACGSIFPFFTNLSGLSSLGEDYVQNIPAGYLKCRGQILSADQYPNLARLLGVGGACLYKKPSSVLLEQNSRGTGGTFQLPDLGSKYITGSSTPGSYFNTTTVNPVTNATLDRAGVETEIISQGTSVDFPYTGDFRVPGRNITLTGNVVISKPASSTSSETISIGQTLGHGHNTNFKISRRINTRNDGLSLLRISRQSFDIYGLFCRQAGQTYCRPNADFGIAHKFVALLEEGTDTGTAHRHFGTVPRILSESKTASTNNVLISASPLTTTVNVNVANTSKMDDIAPKFILCEYLIKY
jgi:hypothetical protein